MAFNICIGNSDDHFRNHGFLLTAKGWTLSPAYDMNPTLNEHQSLLINSKTNKADLSILLDSCEEYMLTPEVAKSIINEVIAAVKDWRVLANRLGIAKREISLFEGMFDGLVFVEVEFDSLDAATAFVPPDWFGDDVTNDRRYHNSYLSKLENFNLKDFE